MRVYEKGDASFKEFGSVIFASGDWVPISLRIHVGNVESRFVAPSDNKTVSCSRWVRPSVAKTIDLKWVEVHATFLVKPDDPDAKIKFIATEAPHGVGSLVSTRTGTVLPMSWKAGLCDRRDVEEQISVPARM